VTDPKIAQRSPYVLAETPGTKWWCACGHSQTQPFCDGSHKRVP
jgi:CDGSH-type Zn-finger protein